MQASPRTRGRLSVLVALVLSFAGLQAFAIASPAQASASGVVISEVYGGGGNGGATFTHDFIELYNSSGAPVSLAGWSVQYRSSAGTTPTITNLSGSIAAGGHYLVQEASNAAVGSPLPTPDATGTAAMSGSSGVVLLVNNTTGVTTTGNFAGAGAPANVVDTVGYGSSATTFETTNTAVNLTATTSAQRSAGGADTDANNPDFTEATPVPENSSSGGPSALAATNPGNKTYTQNTAITPFNMGATGGTSPYTWSDPTNTLPAGLSINGAGQVSGTPTGTGTSNVSLTVTDSASATASTSFTITVNAPGALAATNPGNKTGTQNSAISSFNMAATGGTPPYTWTDPTNTLPAGITVSGAGVVSGTPTGSGVSNVNLTVTDSTSATATTSFTFTISAAGGIKTIAELQGTGERSSFAGTGNAQGTETVTTEGVVTAVNKKGYAGSGNPSALTCGFCGFTIQTGGTGGTVKPAGSASNAIFVFGGSSFTGKNSVGGDITIGDSVRVTGKVSEFAVTTGTPADTGSFTELNITAASAVVPAPSPFAAVIKSTVLPDTYDKRERYESELFAPTDVVITDHFNFQTFGEFGIATGNTPLVQPTEICLDDDATCIANAKADIKNRGWFTEDGSSTSYLNSSNFYKPYLSPNNDIPLPFINKTRTARIGAKVTWPKGGTLDYRNKKWYVMPPRAVVSDHGGVFDDGIDVLDIQQTRAANTAPAPIAGDVKVATYNVENYFITTMQAFAAANLHYTCDYDYDRNQQPILAFQCESPDAIPTAFDSTTGAPTAYGPGLVSAPRGAARQQDLDRQTSKIVTAINALNADVISLEELSNPNKLRMGVTNGPLNPDLSKADQGLGTPIAWRDEAIAYLVGKLNDASTAGKWNFVASPEESTDATSVNHMCATVAADGTTIQPPQTNGTCSWASGQDVIRSGFLYKTATIVPVGPSDLDLPGSGAPIPSPFDNAREPLAQFFKQVGHPNSDGFAVIANHFKSKGDSDPAAVGGNANTAITGAFNQARTEQAKELLRFANEFAAKWNTQKVFLVGDFNSYTMEDPIQTILHDPLNTLGFTKVNSDDTNDTTYIFSHTLDTGIGYGAKGSLDHVFASSALTSGTLHADIWEINGNEPGVYNYGRYNTNITDFWDDTTPFGGSDHNPEIVGFNPGGTASVRDVQIIGSNDFHGRLVASSSDGGAAELAGAVKSLKKTWGSDNSTFVAAGDLIGASTFESFIDKDKPTLKALNAAGLEYSSVGNHEFDQGVGDLVNRVMKPQGPGNADGIPGGLQWQYLASNVKWTTDPDGPGGVAVGDTIAPAVALKPMPGGGVDGGINIGFIGAVTEDLPNLVAPSALTGVSVNPIANAVNEAANTLVLQGADVIVLLVHEGAPSTNCATMQTSGGGTGAFATLLDNLAPNIDAVISGHTHLEYACQFTVPQWVTDGKPITKRPVVSAGQYGVALDQLVYSFDNSTGEPVAVTVNNVGVKGPGSTLFSFPKDPTVAQIVQDAVDAAAVPGAAVIGRIAGSFKRARLQGGVTENRGGESTLGNLVAEAQRSQTPAGGPIAPAQIGFMNPGGLRDDLVAAANPEDVTYKEAAAVQPFANTLVNMDMTGAQIKAVLEQQWQRDPQGNVPSRPFLRLGTSKGFTYTYTEATDPLQPGAKKGTVTSMWLNGTRITDAGVYSVTMNSFLASGGDNFRAFLDGADKRDTGKTDLQAQVDYMAAYKAPAAPLAVDYGQHAVRVTFAGGQPSTYNPGDAVSFNLASLAMSGVGDVTDTTVKVQLNGVDVATGIAVDNTLGNVPNDEAGTASVSFNLPLNAAGGAQKLHVIGNNTGTDVIVPIQIASVEPATRDIQILGINDFHGRIANDSASASAGAGVLAGAVKQFRTANPDTVFAAAGDLIGASTFESFIDQDKPTIDALNSAGLDVSAAGNHEFDQGYNDLVNRVMAPYNASTNPKGGANWDYIAANIRLNAGGGHALAPSYVQEFGSVKVGFVGAVTEHLPELVSPGGISQINVTDVVTEVNAEANALKADGADLIVLLVHEGAPGTDCTAMGNLGTDTDFGSIIKGVNDNVDAIISGHTHLAYNCSFPVAGWSGRPVTERPVVSSGQYGINLNRLVFTVDTATGTVQAFTKALLPLKSCANSTACTNYPVDQPTQDIVNAAVTNADVLGAVELGKIAGPFKRGKIADDTTENRGAESTLGNLVAEVQRWATSTPTAGSAQLAFMNPGGLRQDMNGTGSGSPRVLTYKQAAVVQPFANTLVNMDLTGAQIKATLEQQWQPGGASRPFLKLGISKGFKYTYDPDATQGNRITGMWLNGTPIGLATVYSVTVNSFLATGGDNFTALNGGTGKQDTGQTDLQAMVAYMDEFANTSEGDAPLPVDYKQEGVGIKFPASPPASYKPGDHLTFNVSSWSMTNSTDVKDTEVLVKSGTDTLGSFTLDNAPQAVLPGFDEVGKAAVDFVVPMSLAPGATTLTLEGASTGTTTTVPVTIGNGAAVSVADKSITWGEQTTIPVTVSGNGAAPTGTVTIKDGTTTLGSASISAGVANVVLPARSVAPGAPTLTAIYDGDATYGTAQKTFTLTVDKATPTVNAPDVSAEVGNDKDVTVTVTSGAGADATGTVEIREGATLLGSGTLTAGSATISINSDALAAGVHNLDANYLGDTNFKTGTDAFTLTLTKKSANLNVANASMTYGKSVQVTATLAATATGTVTIKRGSTVLGSAAASGGQAKITIPAKSLLPGAQALTAEYAGDGNFAAGTDSFTVTVAKAASKVTFKVTPKKIKKNVTKAKVKITVSAEGVVPTGQVKVKVKGMKAVTTDIGNLGKAVVKLKTFGSTGDKNVKVTYLGNSLINKSSAKSKITVTV